MDAIADQYKDFWVAFAPYWYLHMGYRQGDKVDRFSLYALRSAFLKSMKSIKC